MPLHSNFLTVCGRAATFVIFCNTGLRRRDWRECRWKPTRDGAITGGGKPPSSGALELCFSLLAAVRTQRTRELGHNFFSCEVCACFSAAECRSFLYGGRGANFVEGHEIFCVMIGRRRAPAPFLKIARCFLLEGYLVFRIPPYRNPRNHLLQCTSSCTLSTPRRLSRPTTVSATSSKTCQAGSSWKIAGPADNTPP